MENFWVGPIADLEAGCVVAIDRHEDHQGGLQEGGDEHGGDYASDLHPQLVILEAKDDNESKQGIEEISKNAKLVDRLKLVLHRVLGRLALSWLTVVLPIIAVRSARPLDPTPLIISSLYVHHSEDGAHH